MDSQSALAQGKIGKIEIIRNNQVFELPEYRNTPNQLRYTNYPSFNYFTGNTAPAAGIIALSTVNLIPPFRILSGGWTYNRNASTFTRVGGLSVIQQSGTTSIITDNGLYGTGNNSGGQTATSFQDASFYSLSNGLDAAPIPHPSDFTCISAKMTAFPTACIATGTSNTDSVTAVASTGVVTRNIVSTTSVVTNSQSIKGIVFGSRSGDSSISTPWAYIVLDTPFSVVPGDQVTVTYTLSARSANQFYNVDKTISEYVQGWPFRYPITSLSGSGSVVTAAVASTPKMHFLSGDRIVVEAVPLRRAITSANSNGSTWTIVANAHGLAVTNTIVHENILNASYNGTYVVASTPDVNTYTVTNAANPGASSGGTVRLNTPGTYFNGEYTVTGVTSTTVTFNNAAVGPTPDLSTCVLTSPDRCKIYSFNMSQWIANTIGFRSCVNLFPPQSISAFPLPANFTDSPYTVGSNGYISKTTSGTANLPDALTLTINEAPVNGLTTADGFNRNKRLAMTRNSSGSGNTMLTTGGATIIDLETPQPKHQGYTLTWRPLPVPLNLYVNLPDYASA